MRYVRSCIVLAVAAAAVALGSTEAQAQADVAGRYTLIQLNGNDLPGVTERTDDCREEVISGTLVLATNGAWSFEFVERETCGSDVDDDTEDESGTYTVDGTTIRFSDDTDEFDADDLDIEDLGTGTPGAEDTLSVTLEDGRTVLTFRRVRL